MEKPRPALPESAKRNKGLVSESTNDPEKDKLLQDMLTELDYLRNVIVNMCNTAPFLEQFHNIIRLKALKDLKGVFQTDINQHKLVLDRGAFDCKYSRLLCPVVLKRAVFEVDALFPEYVTMTREKQLKSHLRGDMSVLNLSPKLLNMIPDSPEMKELAFDLCLEWIVKLETSLDLINRATEYGMVSVKLPGTKFVNEQEKNMPATALVLKTSIHSLLNRTIDNVIEKLFAFTSESICNKVNKLIISSILVGFFGATVVGIGGFAISLIDLPDVNFNFLSGLINPVINNLKKFLRVGDDNICIHVLREAISATEDANQDLRTSIEEIARCDFYSKRQHKQIDHLQDLVDQVLNCKRKSNIRIEQKDVDAYVAYEELHGINDGWILLKDPSDCLDVKEIEGGYGFLQIEVKPNHAVEKLPGPEDDDEFVDLDGGQSSEEESELPSRHSKSEGSQPPPEKESATVNHTTQPAPIATASSDNQNRDSIHNDPDGPSTGHQGFAEATDKERVDVITSSYRPDYKPTVKPSPINLGEIAEIPEAEGEKPMFQSIQQTESIRFGAEQTETLELEKSNTAGLNLAHESVPLDCILPNEEEIEF